MSATATVENSDPLSIDAPAPIELCAGRLHALVNPIELDGRLTWYQPHVRGYTSVNCYLATEDEHALLIDTGVTVHREALLAQLQRLVGGAPMSIAHTRVAEYPAICNTIAIAQSLRVDAIYAGFPDVLGWLEFRPRANRPRADGPSSWALGRAPQTRVVSREDGVAIGERARRLHVMPAAVKLLPSQWFYDDGTRTLFTGDAFTHARRRSAAGPWVADDRADGITPDEVLEHLLARCWWLAGAQRHGEIQAMLEQVFSAYDVETIAPGYGCVIHPRSEVKRHYQLLYDAIGRTAGWTAP
jgi:glyoxylase-like metal-dependent hydrolase (beta-lactamase superfamily II)